MSIKIFNSQSQKKEDFVSIEENKVKMYVCGPTVYGFLHVGNFRGPVVFNAVRNWFEYRGYQVDYVSNFTDIDDKIINRANEENVAPSDLAERYISEYVFDYKTLNLKPHTSNPKATEHIDSMIELIEILIQNEKAYVVDGEVFYSVRTFNEYGKLSHRNLDDMKAGARVMVDEKKRDPADFTLWKPSKSGEPSWNSPWGPGRPGWHIECSAMCRSQFGDTLDIHGGGMDLIFPHHENEIAQSEGASGKPYVRYWMHNNMIQFGSQKMSKSVGNIITAREFLNEYDAEILKYLLLKVHYRSVSDLSEDQIKDAISGLARVYSALSLAKSYAQTTEVDEGLIDVEFEKEMAEAWDGIEKAMDDDFNTPEAFARVFEIVRLFNTKVKLGMKVKPNIKSISLFFIQWIEKVGLLFSLYQEEPTCYLTQLDDRLLEKKGIKREDVDELVTKRSMARKAKDFKLADEVRKTLDEWGITVQDTSQGTCWEVAK